MYLRVLYRVTLNFRCTKLLVHNKLVRIASLRESVKAVRFVWLRKCKIQICRYIRCDIMTAVTMEEFRLLGPDGV